jgi:hypothetical protein
LDVVWAATVGGDAIILDQDVIEVVGGFAFGLAEARSIDVVFANTSRYPTEDVVEVRLWTEDEAEQICGQAFVPRFERETLTGFGDRPLRLTHPHLRKVRALIIDGVATAAADIAAVGADPLGLIRTGREWPVATGSVVAEYEHGLDRPSPDMVRAMKTRWRSLMFERKTRSPLPDRSEAFTRTEVGLVRYGQEGADATGIPAVDAVYARHASPRPGWGWPMAATILGWPLKRVAIARLQSYANGSTPPPAGAELLVSSPDRPVQVEHMAPAEPDRISIYGGPLRATFREITGERPDMVAETSQVEIKVRVYEPGDDVTGIDILLGDMCQAVTTALLLPPLAPQVRVWLASMVQDGGSYLPTPEPSMVASASLFFTGEAVAYGI